MKIVHFHFGKDGGAERFFVHLVNAFAKRGVEQQVVIRPGRPWRASFDPSVRVIESHFRTASLDRVLLPLRVRSMIRKWKPDGILGWMPKGAKLVPGEEGPIRLARLGDYPTSLKKFRNIDVLVCNTPGIARHVRDMGWLRRVEVISNFTGTAVVKPVARGILDTPEDAYVVSSMGRFVPRKGFDVLVRMLARKPDIYLWLVGGGLQP
jgi:glycosyltransferase involved in cell wall biosynthesis